MFSEHPDGSVCADYTADHRHQGYTGLLHGGMTSTLLDAAMTHCLFMQGVQALTAELTVRFISPVCTGDKLMVCARLLGQRRGIYLLLGCFAPGTYHEFSRLTAVNEDKDIPTAKNMIENLVQGQETVVKTARSLFPVVNNANDEATADLLTQRIQLHEKTAWMLRSLLE
ncbi:ferritin-like domain-containing protein [Dickeya oryzae]|uniref:ferritin-like domain-containing protein n=1 Tax=Dickeya oryzae TaxID=1240404 RepID=UPI0024A69255|nr:ferritin-like domain-containing protein [Dickeya oryzae]